MDQGTRTIPGLPGEQLVAPTPDEAARALAARLVAHLGQRLTKAPAVHLAVSGGSSAVLLCDQLVQAPGPAGLDWRRVHLWMVDERVVPDDDPRLNFGLFRDRLAPRLGLPGANLHPMPVLSPGGADSYAHDLETALAGPAHAGRLDAVVLGMGPDGHTASLFPRTPGLDERQRRVVINDGDSVAPPRPRMTLTYPTLNGARLIVLLITGASKRGPLGALAAGGNDPRALPIAGVVPDPGSSMVWFLDQAAAPASP